MERTSIDIIREFTREATREDKLQLIKAAKMIYERGTLGLYNLPIKGLLGMCYAFKVAIREELDIDSGSVWPYDIFNLIPEFNPVELDGNVDPGVMYWWPLWDAVSREQAFLRLIEIYSKPDDSD